MRIHDDVTSPLAVATRPAGPDTPSADTPSADTDPDEGREPSSAPPPAGPRVLTPRTSTVRTPGAATSDPVAPTAPRTGRHALATRVVLVLLVVGVVASIALVVARSADTVGRPENQAEEVPALQVNPAPIQLGTVGQPVGVGLPEGSILPNSALPGLDKPHAEGRGPAAGPTTAGAAMTGPAGGSLASLAAWAHQLAGSTGIPARALQAYGLADLAMRRLAPRCHLSWVTVAGLARIESNHGRFRGSSVGQDGEVNPPIVGVPLDGTNGNTTIMNGGSYAAAMGPLQFIPSTWQRWGTDTHGTGRADANNIDDAAVTAGRYLCAAGGDLSSGPGWRAAVLAYNASDDYARRVYTAADAYAHGGSA